jgi:hypothetical protein
MRAAPLWPFVLKKGAWRALLRCLGRFLALLAALCLVTYLGLGYGEYHFLRGILLFPPVLLVTGAFIVCFDPDWRKAFDPRRHLAMVIRAPATTLKAVLVGCFLGTLLPAVPISAANWLFGWCEAKFLTLGYWYAFAGPLAWYCATASGYGVGLLWHDSRELLKPGLPAKPYEAAIGVGLVVLAVLLSFLLA